MAPRRVHGFGFAVVLGLLAAAEPVTAQTGVWTTHGPVGGNIHCFAADASHPSTIYAGTDVGVFISLDGGASWSPASGGLPVVRVQAIAIDPSSGSLYAGTLTAPGVDSLGIFKSTDGGASWTSINAGLTDPITGISPVDIEALAVDPSDPQTLLAGTQYSEIYKSTDAGATWQAQTLGGFDVLLETSAFLFSSSSPSIVYAATTQGLLRSTDSGDTWSNYGDAGVSFFTLAADPTSPSTLYGGNVSGSGVLKSTNGGAHWSTADKNLPVNQAPSIPGAPLVLALAVDPSHPSTIYAGTYGNGLFQSTDGASSWSAADTGIRDAFVVALSLAPGESSTIYAGTLGGGVYESQDSGQTWTQRSNGIDLSLVSALLVDSTAPEALYAATADGVKKSANAGASWQAADTGLPVDPVAALALDPGSPRLLFAGTLGGGLLESADGGASWSSPAQGLTDSFISAIAVDPTNPMVLYVGTDHPYDGTASERVFKSTDAGGTWTRTSLDAQSFPIGFLAVNPASPSQVVAVSQGSSGYFQSMDAGKTWSTVSSPASCGGVNAIVFSAPTTYLAGTGGVCRSTDGGNTWTVSSVANLASVQVLLVDPANSSTVYAGAAPSVPGGTGGVFRSTDGGASWETVGSGLSGSSVTSLALDSQGTLHAGVDGGGVVELALPLDRSPVVPAPSSGRRTKALLPR